MISAKLTQVGEALAKAGIEFRFAYLDLKADTWEIQIDMGSSTFIEISDTDDLHLPLTLAVEVRSYDRTGGMSGEALIGRTVEAEYAVALVAHVIATDTEHNRAIDAALAATEEP